ncbi:hypothetical protein CNECB9_5180011 [Cupriavidus necator]|uniref:Uncharacterized protein n=1 Tax=Cupriavidus necator TaxID=106590 RepID=A0A1K0INR2_CUPNE|nr:hypothetical protein CNECB9_5180011 [Cupriavidus necator]
MQLLENALNQHHVKDSVRRDIGVLSYILYKTLRLERQYFTAERLRGGSPCQSSIS